MAFRLYDTYGFPLDLTQDALRPRGIAVDVQAFDAAMDRQRQEARQAGPAPARPRPRPVWFDIRERIGASEFLGYDTETAEGVVRASIVEDGKETPELKPGAGGHGHRQPDAVLWRMPAARSAIAA